jgi:hypothetical protein
MKQRGRKSAASLEVGPVLESDALPLAPPT